MATRYKMTMHRYEPPSNYIAGKWVVESHGTAPIYNPATGEEIGKLPLASTADVERALDSAAKGFEVWRKVDVEERCEIMRSAAGHLRDMSDCAAVDLVMEQGK